MRNALIVGFTALSVCTLTGAPPRAEPARTRELISASRDGDAQRAAAAPTARQQLAGAWELVSRTVQRADGTLLNDPVLGQQPLGRLYYDASGVMMLQMMRQGRKAAIATPANPKDAANPRAVLGYDAYFGRYAVDERAGTITHHVEGSLFPEDLGDDWVRPFTLDGDTLTLQFTSTDGQALTRTLVFRRLR
jgi:hypothetical protein